MFFHDLKLKINVLLPDDRIRAGADVYMMKHLLHGCRDEKATTILRNCRAVIPENGTLLIIEFILPPMVPKADPDLEGRLTSDLNMLVVTGGRERSEREWGTLLETADFRLAAVCQVGGHVGIVEAKPCVPKPHNG